MRTEDQQPFTEINSCRTKMEVTYLALLQSFNLGLQLLIEAYDYEMRLLINAAERVGEVPQYVRSLSQIFHQETFRAQIKIFANSRPGESDVSEIRAVMGSSEENESVDRHQDIFKEAFKICQNNNLDSHPI